MIIFQSDNFNVFVWTSPQKSGDTSSTTTTSRSTWMG